VYNGAEMRRTTAGVLEIEIGTGIGIAIDFDADSDPEASVASGSRNFAQACRRESRIAARGLLRGRERSDDLVASGRVHRF
jgi:hypothetical protein